MIRKQYNDASSVAQAIIKDLLIPQLQQGILHLAISGGSTPKLLFELMASPQYRAQIAWHHLRLFWVDERCVPPSDEQSNYGMTAQALGLDSLALSSEHIYRIQGEQLPELEADRYTELVERLLPRGVQGRPRFDLIILGIGDDGHTSSIFPHQMHLLQEPKPYVVAQSPTGQNRICLTGPSILEAKQLIFHAVGASKQTLLRQIELQAEGAEVYPSSFFVKQRADILLYTDQAL